MSDQSIQIQMLAKKFHYFVFTQKNINCSWIRWCKWM